MKLKITVLFLFLAFGLVWFIFNFNKISVSPKDSDIQETISKTFSKQEVFEYLSKAEAVDYFGNSFKFDSSVLKSADIINIHLWASWCAPCVNEVPELIEFAHRVSKNNQKNLKIIFIAVSLDDSPEELNKFLKSFPDFNKEPFYRLWDKQKNLSKLFNADRLPMTVILNKNLSEPRTVRGVVEWKNINF